MITTLDGIFSDILEKFLKLGTLKEGGKFHIELVTMPTKSGELITIERPVRTARVEGYVNKHLKIDDETCARDKRQQAKDYLVMMYETIRTKLRIKGGDFGGYILDELQEGKVLSDPRLLYRWILFAATKGESLSMREQRFLKPMLDRNGLFEGMKAMPPDEILKE